MKRLTQSLLLKISPRAKQFIIDGVVNNQVLFKKYGITNNNRLAHFLAQAAHETGGFRSVEESLYYTSAKRLRQVWRSRFGKYSDKQLSGLVRNPKALANRVYNGRMGNRKGSNDGWNYRGGGIFQTTGRYNYTELAKHIKKPVDEYPSLVREFPAALEAALFYWQSNNLNRFADKGDIRGLTKAINGGYNGLSDRIKYLAKAKKVLGSNTKVLKIGSKGKAVIKLQEDLVLLGYNLKIDGDFGKNTDLVLSTFQEKMGLKPDGVCGAKTKAAIKAALGEKLEPLPVVKENLTDEPKKPTNKESLQVQKKSFITLVIEFIAKIMKGK